MYNAGYLIFYGIMLNVYTWNYDPWFVGIAAFINLFIYMIFVKPSPYSQEIDSIWILFIGIGVSTWPLAIESFLIALIIQLAAVMAFLAFALKQFKDVSANCTDEHIKKVRVKYLTQMCAINIGVIAAINYLKGPWWASLLSNVVTIIYYVYISDSTQMVSARFRRSSNLQDNEEQEELFGINDDI